MKGKSLLFNNWINSNLIYINDLLDEKGKLSKEFICKNLKCKVNWISELYTFKRDYQENGLKSYLKKILEAVQLISQKTKLYGIINTWILIFL